jgi:hypothetical protein
MGMLLMNLDKTPIRLSHGSLVLADYERLASKITKLNLG